MSSKEAVHLFRDRSVNQSFRFAVPGTANDAAPGTANEAGQAAPRMARAGAATEEMTFVTRRG